MFSKLTYPLLILFIVSSCSGKSDCSNSDIDQFDTFLGISRETKEIDLSTFLGETTGGYYSDDNSSFIYTYHALSAVPIAVAVNASTTKAETVVMEILSLGDDFTNDLEKAKTQYAIDACDARFFGIQKEDLIAEMGEPDLEETPEEGIYSITYNSTDFKTSVNFKFYAEQENKCSCVIVNWF